jgi:hypothetical protein
MQNEMESAFRTSRFHTLELLRRQSQHNDSRARSRRVSGIPGEHHDLFGKDRAYRLAIPEPSFPYHINDGAGKNPLCRVCIQVDTKGNGSDPWIRWSGATWRNTQLLRLGTRVREREQAGPSGER